MTLYERTSQRGLEKNEKIQNQDQAPEIITSIKKTKSKSKTKKGNRKQKIKPKVLETNEAQNQHPRKIITKMIESIIISEGGGVVISGG